MKKLNLILVTVLVIALLLIIPVNASLLVSTDPASDTNLLGNNTPVTFSTLQNPILSLSIGNWFIEETATNSLGSSKANVTLGFGLSSPRVHFWNRTV
jgi:hypothetical protein